MTIDWNNFTPWASLAGGILLGLASALFVLVNGRILGISGILGGLLTFKRSDAGWRVAFLLGMLAAPATLAWIAPADLIAAPRIDATYGLVVMARAWVRAAPAATASAGCRGSRPAPWWRRAVSWRPVLPWFM